MMYLTETRLSEIVKKQYKFKWNSYKSVFSSLVIIQLVAILFSLGGVRGGGMNTESIKLDYTSYSADIVIIFTFLWGLMSSLLLTTKAYRQDDFIFVTNRFSSVISSIAFIVTASVIGGIMAVGSGYLLRVLVYYIWRDHQVVDNGISHQPLLLLMGIIATILFILLFSAIGYLAGMIIQVHRVFVVVLSALFIGFFFIHAEQFSKGLYQFYFEESAFIVFLSKMIVTIGILFYCAMLIASRLEVKR
ncbi:hypothetical protein Q7A53_08625 [Halobacillus rhizosphaerae]|uniref:hypothetical protein n=1 Tax=Halobacillus rhizosphaerae TaxID=3064889 RepID=UPI00398B0CB1